MLCVNFASSKQVRKEIVDEFYLPWIQELLPVAFNWSEKT